MSCDCKLIILEYDWNVWNTSVNQEFPPDPACNGLTFFNTGAAGSVCVVNGVPLPVGGSLSIGGNFGEIFKGRVPITFPNFVAGQQCTVVQKYYKSDLTNKMYKQ